MKKKKERKLFLNKEIVSQLTPSQQRKVIGGESDQAGIKSVRTVVK